MTKNVTKADAKLRIRHIMGSLPHPSYGGWFNFLAGCEVRDEYDGVVYYGKVNCNYLLFPDGTLITNYGYHGKALMSEIRGSSWDKVLKKYRALSRELEDLLR